MLTGLLRDELGYDGLIFTDSLEMGALAESGYPPPVAAATALAAGADVLLFNHGHELHRQAQALILDRLARGQLPASRLDAAARRVLAAKERFGLLETGARGRVRSQGSGGRGRASRLGTAEHRALAREIAAQAITLLRDDARRLPLAPDAKLLVIEPPAAAGLGKALARPRSSSERIPPRRRSGPRSGWPPTAARSSSRPRTRGRTPARRGWCRRCWPRRHPVIVVAVRGPYDLMAFPAAPTYLASYGANPPALEALAAVLVGQLKPGGRLPVELPGLYPVGAGLGDFVR